MTHSESGEKAAFSGLVAGIAAATAGMLQQVGSLMGEEGGSPATSGSEAKTPEQRAESVRVGLANARQYIDTLVMLQQKTAGNLTQEEAQLLSAVLTDLRLTFVRLNDRWSAGRRG
jgi:hypothetical protein